MKRYIISATEIPNRYNAEAWKLIDKLVGGRNIYFNTLYHRADRSMRNNICFYENTKGYFHIIIPETETMDGEVIDYCYIDYLLTKDGNMKETARYKSKYDSKSECVQALLNACDYRGTFDTDDGDYTEEFTDLLLEEFRKEFIPDYYISDRDGNPIDVNDFNVQITGMKKENFIDSYKVYFTVTYKDEKPLQGYTDIWEDTSVGQPWQSDDYDGIDFSKWGWKEY